MAINLLDYGEQWENLDSNPNPFAVVVMAHLKAQEMKNKAQERKNWKFQLVDEQKFNKPSLNHEQQTEFNKPFAHAGDGKPWAGQGLLTGSKPPVFLQINPDIRKL